MAFKEFQIEDLGTVTVYKRRGTQSLRLSIRADGSLRVTIPTWTPYATGVSFAKSRAAWIKTHAREPAALLTNGQLIGKAHRIQFIASPEATKVTTRLRQTEIIITYPPSLNPTSTSVQKAAATASIRALRAQAEQLLPIRLRELAEKHDFQYRSVGVKQLKTRWGSCDQDKNIILNLFLMLLPWQLIDYVLLHELTHTRVLQHGPKFWQAMTAIDPKTPELRKEIRTRQPTLQR
jgi:predicted metal-dependent hydrolase